MVEIDAGAHQERRDTGADLDPVLMDAVLRDGSPDLDPALLAEVVRECDALAAALRPGERVTLERLRVRMKRSGNLLLPHHRAWKELCRARTRTPPRPALDTGQHPVETPAAAQPALDGLSKAVETLRGSVDALPRAFAQVSAATAETERQRSTLEVQAINAGADARVKAAEDEAADERGNVDLFRQELDAKDGELRDLGAKLADASEEAGKLRTALGGESTRAVELGEALERAVARREEATARVAELEGLLEAARREGSVAAGAAESARAEARDLGERRDALQAQLMERSAELAEARTEIALAQQAARSAEAAARAGEEARDAAVQQVHEEASQAAELRSALGRATARAAELDGLLEAARREGAVAAGAAESARAEVRDLGATRDLLQAQLTERLAELAEARTGIAVAQQAARSAEAAARVGEEARDVAVQQARADAGRAGAAEARAQAAEDLARKLEADLERFQNTRSPMPAT